MGLFMGFFPLALFAEIVGFFSRGPFARIDAAFHENIPFKDAIMFLLRFESVFMIS